MKSLIRILMKLGLANYVANQLSRPSGWFGSRVIGRMMNRGNAHLEKTAFELIDLKPGHHVLEIGFGNGRTIGSLLREVVEGKVHGVDISEDLINQVSRTYKGAIEKGNLELHLAGVSRLPLPDNSIDRILTCNTIYFWPDPLKDAQELLRVMKPGGKLIVGYRTKEEMNAYPFVSQNPEIFKNQFSDDGVKTLLEEAGFNQVKITVKPFELAPSHVALASSIKTAS